jgi:hypothetical protein
MTVRNRLFGLIGFAFVIIGFTGKIFYRDYINSNKINDFGISGFLPSYFYVIGFSFLLLMSTSKFPKITFIIVTTASILYEFIQYVTHPTLDVKDIIASIAGGLTCFLLWNIIDKMKKI